LLHHLGHERVGAIQGPTEYSTGRDRAVGLRQALRAEGIHIRREHVRRVAYSYDGGFRAATDLLNVPEPPTALFCANDVVAIGALAASRACGLRVPEELTVVGFDDIPMAGWGMVELTTMRCDVRALAKAAIDLLLESLQGRPARHVTVPTVLVPRGTHGPAPVPGVPAPSRSAFSRPWS
jgi:LacI family transcriptional regulator